MSKLHMTGPPKLTVERLLLTVLSDETSADEELNTWLRAATDKHLNGGNLTMRLAEYERIKPAADECIRVAATAAAARCGWEADVARDAILHAVWDLGGGPMHVFGIAVTLI